METEERKSERDSERTVGLAIVTVAFFMMISAVALTGPLSALRPASKTPITLKRSELERLQLLEGTTPLSLDVVITAPGRQRTVATQIHVTENVRADQDLIIVGWAVDASSNKPAQSMLLSIEGAPLLPVVYGSNRPDVATALHNDAFENSGFRAEIAPGILKIGKHKVDLIILNAAGTAYYRIRNRVTINELP